MIAAYKGISPLSRSIRFFNDGPYSHVAWIDDDTGDVYESWTSGVRKTRSVHHNHTPGTPVDVFAVSSEGHVQRTVIRHFMISQIGKPYDWPGVFRFMTRGKDPDSDNPPHWFCSRLVACAYRYAGIPLLWAPDWKMNPTDCTYSLRIPHGLPYRSLRTVDVKLFDNRKLIGCETADGDPEYLSRGIEGKPS